MYSQSGASFTAPTATAAGQKKVSRPKPPRVSTSPVPTPAAAKRKAPKKQPLSKVKRMREVASDDEEEDNMAKRQRTASTPTTTSSATSTTAIANTGGCDILDAQVLASDLIASQKREIELLRILLDAPPPASSPPAAADAVVDGAPLTAPPAPTLSLQHIRNILRRQRIFGARPSLVNMMASGFKSDCLIDVVDIEIALCPFLTSLQPLRLARELPGYFNDDDDDDDDDDDESFVEEVPNPADYDDDGVFYGYIDGENQDDKLWELEMKQEELEELFDKAHHYVQRDPEKI